MQLLWLPYLQKHNILGRFHSKLIKLNSKFYILPFKYNTTAKTKTLTLIKYIGWISQANLPFEPLHKTELKCFTTISVHHSVVPVRLSVVFEILLEGILRTFVSLLCLGLAYGLWIPYTFWTPAPGLHSLGPPWLPACASVVFPSVFPYIGLARCGNRDRSCLHILCCTIGCWLAP